MGCVISISAKSSCRSGGGGGAGVSGARKLQPRPKSSSAKACAKLLALKKRTPFKGTFISF